MSAELEHYVEFIYPGSLVNETSSEKITHRDPDKVKVPNGSFAFRFYDLNVTYAGTERLTGDPKNHSGLYYINGKVYTEEEIKRDFPEETILISNASRYKKMVKTRRGTFQPFEKEDFVIWWQGKKHPWRSTGKIPEVSF